MVNVLQIWRGSVCIADGATAHVVGGVLSSATREMATVLRPRAAQIAVVDLGNTQNAVQSFTISRQFSSSARAQDHALRAAQTAVGQHDLVIKYDDGTDVHTWTLSDINGDGAAWKSAAPPMVNGVRCEMRYEVTGGLWTYDGPLAGTYSDGITEVAADSLTRAIAALLALSGFPDSSELLELHARSIPGPLVFPGATLAGTFGVFNDATLTALTLQNTSLAGAFTSFGNSALTTLSPALLASLAGTFTCTSCAALTALAFPALASLAGTLAVHSCNALTSLNLAALTSLTGHANLNSNSALATITVGTSIATTSGFTFNASSCALNTATVNALLAAFAAGLGSTTSGTINLSSGANASPTGGTSNAAYLTLTGAGLTVNIN
jgi:hypothetical protein